MALKTYLMLGSVAIGLLLSGCATPETQPATTTEVRATPTEQTESSPDPSTATKASEFKFTDKDGNVQTFEAMKQSIQLPVSDHRNGPEALEAYVEVHMSNMIDYRPTEEEVRSNLKLGRSDKLTLEHYSTVAQKRNEAFDHLYDVPTGDLHAAMQRISLIGIKNWFTSIEDPTKPYDPMSLTYDPINSKITLSDSTEAVYYKISGPDLTTSIAKVPQYEIPGRMSITTIK